MAQKIVFPDRDIDPKKKGESYHLQWTRTIYEKYKSNRTAWGPNIRTYWDILRSYSEGRQDPNIYKSWLLGEDASSSDDVYNSTALGRVSKRLGFDNVAFDIVSPLPMVVNNILYKLDDIDFDIHVDVVDEKHVAQEEENKWKMIFEGQESDFINTFMANMGIAPENKKLPTTEKEYELMIEAEGEKISIAKAMQKLLRYAVEKDGKWGDVLSRKIKKDLIDLGYASVSVVYDVEKKRFIPEYRDVRDVVIQYSRENDFNDSEYAGYFRVKPISELKLKRSDIPEEKWRELAKKNMGLYGNPSDVSRFDNYYSVYAESSYPYDDFKVSVFECEWIDTDYYKSLEYTSVYGRTTYHRLDYDSEVKELSEKQKKKGAKQKVIKVPKRVVRECKWVVGSDITYDWGLVHMPGKPSLRIKVEVIPGKSIIEQLIFIADEFMKGWLRHQDTLAKMFEKGYALNVGLLQNVTDGDGKSISWESLIDMWKHERVMPYMLSLTGQYQGGDVTPIHEIPGGLGERLNETIAHINWCFQMIERMTGINLVALGASPQPEAQVTTTKWALQGTADALKSVITASLELKQNMAYMLMRRIQVGLKNSEEIRNAYLGAIGKNDIMTMAQAEKEAIEYGISMRYRPDADYKSRLFKYIQLALTPGRDGVPLLEVDDAMYFEEALSRGADPIEIRQQITYKIRQRRMQFAQEKMAYIDRQNQGLAAIQQQKSESDAQIKQLESELRAKEEQIKGLMDIQREREKGRNDIIQDLIKKAEGTPQEIMDQIKNIERPMMSPNLM